jgi:hypothetical protein
MKKLGKLQINSEKVIKNEELLSLRGGSGSFLCYRAFDTQNCCDTSTFITGINTASCEWAQTICGMYGGLCVKGGDCIGAC